jgi:sec-independent protein translocase protein TatC
MSFEDENSAEENFTGEQMSFMEHLDELRKRLINSVIILTIAFCICFAFSKPIFQFLEVPVNRALAEAQRREIPYIGLTGNEKVLPLNQLKEGDKGVYVFERATKIGTTVVAPGTLVDSVVGKDNNGNVGLFSSESILTNDSIIPQGSRLPLDFQNIGQREPSASEQLTVTTATEPFMLYVTVSIYSAIALALPLLLLQIWGFIAPALHKHERAYVTPFVLLSSISFIVGAAFAYYVLFPPAVKYLLGVGENFQLMLRATDYFDLITLIMLAMGLVFQMPAIAYVLARIGVINARFLVKSWKISLIVILIVAAVASPTPDAFNMMLFAAPMVLLYIVSIFVAWFFGKKRKPDNA